MLNNHSIPHCRVMEASQSELKHQLPKELTLSRNGVTIAHKIRVRYTEPIFRVTSNAPLFYYPNPLI